MDRKADRPKLSVPLRPLDLVIEAVAVFGLLLAIYAGYLAYTFEGKIPTHFNASGEPDAYGGKFPVLLMTAVLVVLYITLTILNRYPHIFNYTVAIDASNAPRQYALACRLIRFVKLSVTWIFAYILLQTYSVARGAAFGLGPWFLPVVLLATSAPIVIYLVVSHTKTNEETTP